nr:hypothetical protein BaRGS_020337 [Batillaria attramentaria]
MILETEPCDHVRKVTFLDTIRYAIDEGAWANRHFMPIYSLCSPCHVDYDIIGKMETFMEDAESVLAMASKVTLSQFLQLVKDAYAFTNAPGQREVVRQQREMAMMEAYHSLPRSLLKRLQASVQKDCDLFDYECDVDVRFNVSMKSAPVFHFDQF